MTPQRQRRVFIAFPVAAYIYMMGRWSDSISFELRARAADKKLMVSVSSPSPLGSGNDGVGPPAELKARREASV